ncbi:MAG: heavy-metal-associated domain-containing protein [Candidatus Ranarchaeia archaeon]|jgi:copper chaperone CopZ
MVETILIIDGPLDQKNESTIRDILQGTKGVNHVVISLESKIAIIDFNQDRITEKQIVAVFTDSGLKVS